MIEPETRYPTLEKMALAVVNSARKRLPLFLIDTIKVLTNQPLRTMMSSHQSDHLAKWAVVLSEQYIIYKNRTTAKSQVLANFLIELPP